jgi:uncharacterized metal-binding protein YceD (DUF177 family)
MKALPAITRPVAIATIGHTPLSRRVEIDEPERKAIAAAIGLVDIVALSADFLIGRERGGTIRVDGQLTAEIVQTCVVSLEPVHQRIEEPILARFIESSDESEAPPSTVDIVESEEDPPEFVSGPILDLGPIVIEHFLLAIDPYPHAPCAEPVANPLAEERAGNNSPFGMLASLAGRKSTSSDH